MDLPPPPGPPLEVIIRPVGREDLAAIGSLRREAMDLLAHQRGGRRLLEELAPPESLSEALSDPQQVWLLAFLGTAAVGHAGLLLAADRHAARTLELFVSPRFRGIGIGDRLLLELADRARRGGHDGLDAVVLPGDRNTKNFFEAHGMVARSITVHTGLRHRGATP